MKPSFKAACDGVYYFLSIETPGRGKCCLGVEGSGIAGMIQENTRLMSETNSMCKGHTLSWGFCF